MKNNKNNPYVHMIYPLPWPGTCGPKSNVILKNIKEVKELYCVEDEEPKQKVKEDVNE